jgi:hypothetical protein
MQLHVDPDVIRQSSREHLRLLVWSEATNMCHARLERI